MARAYTLRYTRAGLPVRWATARVPLRVDPALAASAGESTEAARLAVAAWAGLAGVPALALDGEVRLAPGYAPRGDNENGVYRVESLPVSGVALAVTVSTYRQDDGVLLDADVLVLASRELALLGEAPRGRELRRHDLASLLAHESGHVLGLGETADDEAATMWPTLRLGDTSARTLEPDDEAGVLGLYADAAALDADAGALPQGCGVLGPRGRGPSAGAGLFALGSALLAVALRRRARRHAVAGAALLALLASVAASRPAARADDRALGRARVLEVRWQDGLLVTELEVRTATGRERLVVAGGALDGLVQQVGEELPPADGDEVWLGAVDARGLRAWGSLAQGAAPGEVRTTRGRPPASARRALAATRSPSR